jgi:flagellar basal body-associated protein FliL
MAEAKDKPDKAKAKDKDPKAKGETTGKAKLTGILAATVTAVIAALAGVGVTMILRSAGPDTAEGADELDQLDPVHEDFEFAYHTFERITVSLKSDRGHSYLIAVIVLKIKKPYMEAVQKRLEEKKREVKDLLISYLGGLTVKEVLGTTNQNRIKRELRDRLNRLLWPNRRPGIYAVMFDEFQTD